MALLALPLTVSAEEAVFDFKNNNLDLPVGEGTSFTDGALNDPVTVGEVTLTSVKGDAFYPAIVMKGNDGVIALSVYKNGAIKFNAAEGKAIVKVEATMKSKTFALTPSTGSITDNTWQGNATEVTFSADALYSFLKIVVTTADKNAETEEPEAAAWDVEADNIAAFNAVEDGKVVKLTLNNVKVNGVYNGAYVEDASGATVIKGVTLTAGTALNGYIVGTKSTDNDIDYLGATPAPYEPQLTAIDASTFEATETTLIGTVMALNEAGKQANYGRLITLENVAISGGGQNKTLTDADGNTIKARDYMGVLPAGYTWPEQASKITGVVIYYMSGWFLMPISADAIVAPVAGEETALFDFANNNLGLTAGKGGASDPVEQQNAGNLGGKTLTQDDVEMSFVNPATMPVRYYYLATRGNHLQMAVKDAQMRITAPEGRAITKIEVAQNALESKPNDNNVKWEVAQGAGTWDVDTKVWTGNAASVLFNATAATYINAVTVTTAPANEQTVSREDDEEIVEAASLAELAALTDGTHAELTLNNAVVVSQTINQWGFYVQDATGGAHFYCTGLLYQPGDVLNGTVKVKHIANNAANPGNRIAMVEATNGEGLTVTTGGQYTPITGSTVEEVNKVENISNVIQLTGVAVKGSAETTATITDAEGKELVIENSKTNYAPYVYQENLTTLDMASATVTGILYYSNFSKGEVKLYPLSITETTGISAMEAAATDNVVVYNLQGQRVDQPQKGLYIVNGRKVVIR